MPVGYPILVVEQLPNGAWRAEGDGISASGGTEAEALANLKLEMLAFTQKTVQKRYERFD